MKYDDLLGQPYEKYGNCYGLVCECCRRAGTPLKNPFENMQRLKENEKIDYTCDINIKEIDRPIKGCIVEYLNKDKSLHVGYMVTRDSVIHSTKTKGVRLSHISLMHITHFYEVIK